MVLTYSVMYRRAESPLGKSRPYCIVTHACTEGEREQYKGKPKNIASLLYIKQSTQTSIAAVLDTEYRLTNETFKIGKSNNNIAKQSA